MAANQRVNKIPNDQEGDGIDGDHLGEASADEAAQNQKSIGNAANLLAAQAITNVNQRIARNKALHVNQGKPYQEPSEDEKQAQIEKEMDHLATKADRDERKRREREAAKDAQTGSRGSKSDSGGLDWARNWYLLTRNNRYIQIGMKNTMSSAAISDLFDRYKPSGEKGSAHGFIRANTRFEEAFDTSYSTRHGPVFDYRGSRFVNSYRPDSVPAVATQYTHEGIAAIDTIRHHLRNLFGNERDADMVESWIALNVRQPGKLFGVALLVRGTPGDGKTILFRGLMDALMGPENVNEVGIDELNSRFSDWAKGAALCVAEELKLANKNRHEVINKIKPFVTNDHARITGKGQDGVSYPNCTNYVGLTNHDDALPIDRTDRRWWILFTPYGHYSELEEKVGSLKTYFGRIASAIREHADELRKYFMECPIHPEIFHNMLAPDTAGRQKMIAKESNALGGDFLDAFIAEAEENPPILRKGISREVLLGGELSLRLAEAMESDPPRGKQLARLIESRGYHPFENLIYWQKKTYHVYVSNKHLAADTPVNRKTVRDLLDQTIPPDQRSTKEESSATYYVPGSF